MTDAASTPCCAVTRRLAPDAVARVNAALTVLGQPGATKLAQIAAWPEVAAVGLSQPTLSKHRKHLQAGERANENARVDGSPLVGIPTVSDDRATAPRKLVTAAIEERCVELRVAGKTYREIVEEVGIDEATAIDVVERVLVRTIGRADRKAEQAREIDLRRCDAMIDANYPTATGQGIEPDVRGRAGGVVLRALERRAKLLGLDTATGSAQMPFYLCVGFDEFLSVLLAPLESHPEQLQLVMDAVRGHIAMLAAQKPAKPGLRLVRGAA